jgi:hypothetical protein
MINTKKSILQLDKPGMVLDELSLLDLENTKDKDLVKSVRNSQEIAIGVITPFITINSYNVNIIKYLKMDMNQQIPELLLIFETVNTQFLYSGYPKDGDLLCLFFRAQSELYKPIRHDYTIIDVTGPPPDPIPNMSKSTKSYSTYYRFIIRAQLRIPGIYKDYCKAYRSMTSFEALRSVAKELNLGFASNEKNTSDRMTWICPNQGHYEFIDTVVSQSFKGEEDSFEWWIDAYYNLNFVNINKQLFGPDSKEVDSILAAVGPNYGVHGGLSSADKPGETEFPLILTNDPEFLKYPNHISSFNVMNNAGEIVNNFGYKTTLQFYDNSLTSDSPKNKYVNYDVQSTTPKKLGPNDILLRGRPNEKTYQVEYKKLWIGTKYFDNAHQNIHQAVTQNILNRVENYKIFLRVELNSYVPWLYRGQVVPVRIVHFSAPDIESQIGDRPEKDRPVTGGANINIFLSGVYIILGISLEFGEDGTKTILKLGKRNWAVNPGIASEPEPITSEDE